MKRILLSGTIALGLHIIFFVSLPVLLQETHKPARPEIKSVMVTMSYQPVETKKEKMTKKPVKKIIKKSKPAPKLEPKAKPSQQDKPNYLPKADIKPKTTDNQDVSKKNPSRQAKESLNKNKELSEFTEPFYKRGPLLKYPLKARKRGYDGTVELMIQVSEKGKVSNLWIFKSSNYKSLDNHAVKIVQNWIFEPGKKNGRPETMWVKIPVKFKLQKN